MEDCESQASELSFGVPCVGKVNGIRKMEKKEVSRFCDWTWFAVRSDLPV